MDAAAAASASVTPAPAARVPEWKKRLSLERSQAKTEFESSAAPAVLLRRLRTVVDRQLREIWRNCGMPHDVALLAVGGYGRGELYPHSDVDLLVLLPRPADSVLERRLEQLIGVMWDVGLEVGHSVRTIDECIAMAEHDITVQTTL